MIRTTYFLLLVILAAAKADKMREFDVKMVDCDACGMNLDAKLAIKVTLSALRNMEVWQPPAEEMLA